MKKTDGQALFRILLRSICEDDYPGHDETDNMFTHFGSLGEVVHAYPDTLSGLSPSLSGESLVALNMIAEFHSRIRLENYRPFVPLSDTQMLNNYLHELFKYNKDGKLYVLAVSPSGISGEFRLARSLNDSELTTAHLLSCLDNFDKNSLFALAAYGTEHLQTAHKISFVSRVYGCVFTDFYSVNDDGFDIIDIKSDEHYNWNIL